MSEGMVIWALVVTGCLWAAAVVMLMLMRLRLSHAQENTKRVDAQVEKLRDKWEEFQKSDAAMEATRGRKVDALFEVVDSMRETVRGIPAVLTSKVDEVYKTLQKEMHDELRAAGWERSGGKT